MGVFPRGILLTSLDFIFPQVSPKRCRQRRKQWGGVLPHWSPHTCSSQLLCTFNIPCTADSFTVIHRESVYGRSVSESGLFLPHTRVLHRRSWRQSAINGNSVYLGQENMLCVNVKTEDKATCESLVAHRQSKVPFNYKATKRSAAWLGPAPLR